MRLRRSWSRSPNLIRMTGSLWILDLGLSFRRRGEERGHEKSSQFQWMIRAKSIVEAPYSRVIDHIQMSI